MKLRSHVVPTFAVIIVLGMGVSLLWYTTLRPMRDQSIAPVTANQEEESSPVPVPVVPLETATGTPVLFDSAPPSNQSQDPVDLPTRPVPAIQSITPPIISTPPTSIVPSSTTTPVVPTPLTWKEAIATVFWVGEGESSDNGYIHNRASAWDEDWVGTFGGVDDPDDRCGFAPCGFTPQQSPFYVALPYLEYLYDGYKRNAQYIPWYTKDALEADTLVHGHWVAVRNGSTVCYGQWRDTGPFETDDFAYVFGTATVPRNTEGVGAGIDLSPAMRDCLGVGDVSTVSWRFVDDGAVPTGPWQP